jgi:O-antigen ligase
VGQVLARGDLYHVVADKTISAVPARPAVSFRLFLVCSFVLLGRPQDILTFLQPWRPALVVTVLAVAAMVFGARRQELSAALATPESKRYLLFYLIMIVGIPFAYHRRIAFEGVVEGYVVNMLFFVLLVFQVTSLQRLRSLVWVICLCTVMYSVFGGLLQAGYVGGGRLSLVGHMFDPNDTAFLLVSLFPLCLYFVRFDEGMLKRLVAVAAIFSAIAMILQTGSRGGILGFGVVLLILLLTKAGGIEKSYKWLIVVMLVSTLLLFRDAIDIERYLTLTDLSSDYNLSSQGGRLELWQAALDLSLANPVTGVGVNCFSWAHYLASLAAGESYLRYHAVHNSYLQVSAEIGLFGFGVFMFIVVRSCLTFFRTSRIQVQPETRETSEMSALGGLMLLGFAGLLVSGFFLSQGYSIFFTLYFGLAAAMGRLQARPTTGIETTRGAADTSERSRGGGHSGKSWHDPVKAPSGSSPRQA